MNRIRPTQKLVWRIGESDVRCFSESRDRRPNAAPLRVATANLEAMLDWYGKVLGMTTNHQTSKPMGPRGPSGVRVAWVSNDEANHRIAIVELPGLVDDSRRIHHRRMQHVAFEYPTVDEVLATYAQLEAPWDRTCPHGGPRCDDRLLLRRSRSQQRRVAGRQLRRLEEVDRVPSHLDGVCGQPDGRLRRSRRDDRGPGGRGLGQRGPPAGLRRRVPTVEAHGPEGLL